MDPKTADEKAAKKVAKLAVAKVEKMVARKVD